MNQAYLWDTNIAVYYLQQHFPPYAGKVMDEIAQNSRICLSAITEIALFSWKTATAFDFDLANMFVDMSLLFELKKTSEKRQPNCGGNIIWKYQMPLSQQRRCFTSSL